MSSPILWQVQVSVAAVHRVDVSDSALAPILGPGRDRRLKSWGHAGADGVHFLAHRGGTDLHTDTAYLRYSCQLVLRNDGTRIRGAEPDLVGEWHPPMRPGALYCLDTHVEHQGVFDRRLTEATSSAGLVKVVIAVDRDEPLDHRTGWSLVCRYLRCQLSDFPLTNRPPRWRPPIAS